jgi:hypothetical protein
MNVSEHIHKQPKWFGLVPIHISPSTGEFRRNSVITLGARGRSQPTGSQYSLISLFSQNILDSRTLKSRVKRVQFQSHACCIILTENNNFKLNWYCQVTRTMNTYWSRICRLAVEKVLDWSCKYNIITILLCYTLFALCWFLNFISWVAWNWTI